MLERKRKQLAKKMMAHPGMIKQFIKVYNLLCPECRAKVIKNPSMPMSEYCQACLDKALPILKEAQEKLNE